MMGVGDSGALFFVGDFSVEIAGHAREFGHHGLDLLDPPPLLVGLEPLQANERVSRFHHYALHTTTTGGERPPDDSTPRDSVKMAQEGCSLVSGGDEAVDAGRARHADRET